MSQQLLIDNIQRYVQLDPNEQELLLSYFKPKKIKKKHFLFQEGEVHKNGCFVLSGCLRCYSIDKNGFEHVIQFGPAGWWVGDMHSALNGTPGILNADAIYDSEMLIIARADQEKVYNEIPKVERYFRILSERSLAAFQQRMIGNLSNTALERYDSFCALYPSLIEILPQKQIASYIGVTPEFLSKMLSSPRPR